MAGRRTPTHTGKYGQAAPQGSLQYYGPAPCPEQEVWHLRNCLCNVRRVNADLQGQINSMEQEIENLKRVNAEACHKANTEKDKVCRLEAILKAKDRECDDEERQKLIETIEVSESKVSELTRLLQLEEEKVKVSERECTEKINKLVTRLGKSEVGLLQVNKRKRALVEKLKEIAELLLTQETAHKRHKENWQQTHNMLQEELISLSTKDQILEEAIDNMEKEIKKLQKKNTKLVAEQKRLQKDNSTMVKDKEELEQKNANLKEEKTNFEQENAKLKLEMNEVMKERNQLVADKKNLQEENTELAEDKKIHEEHIAELKALCMKMQRKRGHTFFHCKNEVDAVAAMLEKERRKREKEKNVKEEQEKDDNKVKEVAAGGQ
ncbi:hypothetical protein EXN66_Car019762 [Channa argus]|uniref:Uncharacterized protein n=1 Tax=Channa argus TaxID=215402 RepID=A0A6G1QNL7_CHAAH|nr:hypothetical protein EXN66_Car019762 [Channa argus]KAK2884440.1 hypothetical protein Q8A73_020914 [Channa argus]